MQRITRLISGPPSRGRWGTRAGIAVVLVAGTLLVVHSGLAHNTRPGLRIRSTTDGVLRPGDMREISAHGLDGDRFYRADVDANGRLVEVYKRDGAPRPIDAGVRRWLAEVARISVPPAPPIPPPPPPKPPLPPRPYNARTPPAPGTPQASNIPDAPPMPPEPPAPPEISDSAEFQSLVRVVAADPGVVARLGTPVAMAAKDVHGRIDLDAQEMTYTPSNGRTLVRADPTANGDADVRFELTGPKGRATVHVDAQLKAGTWSMKTIDLQGPAR